MTSIPSTTNRNACSTKDMLANLVHLAAMAPSSNGDETDALDIENLTNCLVFYY